MVTKHTGSGKAKSIPEGLAIAALSSMLITVISSAAIAYCLSAEKISWIQAGYWIMGMLFIAAFAGGKSAILSIKRKRLAIGVMSAVLYWGLLLCTTALFFGGKFSALWETAAIIGAGSGTSVLISMPYRKNSGRKTGGVYR